MNELKTLQWMTDNVPETMKDIKIIEDFQPARFKDWDALKAGEYISFGHPGYEETELEIHLGVNLKTNQYFCLAAKNPNLP